MSDLFKDLVGKAKETLDPIADKAKEKAGELKDAAASGELKEKAGDLMDKAAPVIDKVKGAAGDVIDKVKGAAATVMSGEKPTLDVKNELFAQLDEQVAENRDAIQEQAQAMEEKIREMLGDKKDGE